MTTYIPQVGTVSHGTLRTQDLLSAFANELRRFDTLSSLVAEADAVALLASFGWSHIWGDDATSELVNALQDALCAHAPDGMTFGTTEGDGSDFGWWAIDAE